MNDRGEENEKSNSVSTTNGFATSLWDSCLLFCDYIYLCFILAIKSVLSLFFVSQVLMQFCCNYWFGGFLYFLFTGAAIVGIAYFIFFGDMQFLSKCLTPIALVGTMIIGLLVAFVMLVLFYF